MTQKFYVTLTWHDWSEGGSYGTVVEAESYEDAEQLADHTDSAAADIIEQVKALLV